MSVRMSTHGARRSTNFLLLRTDMAGQLIVTKLPVLQVWYHLCRLWASLVNTQASSVSAATVYRFAQDRTRAIPGMLGCRGN